MLDVEIVASSAEWEAHPDLPGRIERILAEADKVQRAEAGGAGDMFVSVVLSDDAAQRSLNRDWRGKDAPTNVLSFPAAPFPAPGPRNLGDIVLAYETIKRESDENGRPFEAHALHLAAHGFLHLLGYDHETESDAERMERLETIILTRLGLDDPYADTGYD